MKWIKNKKGFIHPLLLVILFALIGGVVFFSQGGNDSLLANLSRMILGDQDNIPEEVEESPPETVVSPDQTDLETKEDQEEKKEETFKVVSVIDGDTIIIEGGKQVEYLGVDAPETVDPSEPVECYGTEAAHKNKDLVQGKEVRLEKDVTDRDNEGNLLRYVWVDDLLVNEVLIKEGFARIFIHHPNDKYSYRLADAEEEARKEKKGLWKVCRVSPWEVSFNPSEQEELKDPGLIEGCTDLAAVNFDPRADVNDQSCRYYQRKQSGTPSDETPPQISNVIVEDLSTSSAVIYWETDEPATSRIQFGTSTPPLKLTIFDPELTTRHRVRLEDLEMGTTYYYRIISLDAYNNHPYFFLRGFSTLHINGRLSLTVQEWAPDNPVVIMGEKDKKLGAWELSANKVADLEIIQVPVFSNHPSGNNNVSNLRLWCGGTEMNLLNSNFVSNRVVFRSDGAGSCIIPRGESITLTLYGDINSIEEGGRSGEKLQFYLSLPESIGGTSPDSLIVKSGFGFALSENPGKKVAPPIYPLQTSLMADIECHHICAVRPEKKKQDILADLGLHATDSMEAFVESVTINVQGDTSSRSTGTPFYLQDPQGKTVAEGVLPSQEDNVTLYFKPFLSVNSNPQAFYLITDTNHLLGDNGKYLNLSIDSGGPEEDGGFAWYDHHSTSSSPVTWIENREDLSVKLGYY